METLEQFEHHSDVVIINFEEVEHIVLEFSLLNLNINIPAWKTSALTNHGI